MNYKVIEFGKPLYWDGDSAYINLSIDLVKKMRKENLKIVIRLPEGYCKPVDPRMVLKLGKKTDKVFLRPEDPMKLIGYYYKLFSPDIQERIKEDSHYLLYY